MNTYEIYKDNKKMPSRELPNRIIKSYNPDNKLESADLSILKSLDETYKIRDTYTEKSVIDYFDNILSEFIEGEEKREQKKTGSKGTICLKKVTANGQNIEIHLGKSESAEKEIRRETGAKRVVDTRVNADHETAAQKKLTIVNPARNNNGNALTGIREAMPTQQNVIRNLKESDDPQRNGEKRQWDQSNVIIELITANSDRQSIEVCYPVKRREKKGASKNHVVRNSSYVDGTLFEDSVGKLITRPRSECHPVELELLKTANKSGVKTELRKGFSQPLKEISEGKNDSVKEILSSKTKNASLNTQVSSLNNKLPSSINGLPSSNSSIPSTVAKQESSAKLPIESKKSNPGSQIDIMSSFRKNIFKFTKEKKNSEEKVPSKIDHPSMVPSIDPSPDRKVAMHRTVRGFDSFMLY